MFFWFCNINFHVNNLVAINIYCYIYQRNPRLFGIVLDDNFKNAANSEIKILEVKIKDLQKASTAAKKAYSSKQPIVKKIPASKSIPVTISVNNPLHAEILAKNTFLTVPKDTVSIENNLLKLCDSNSSCYLYHRKMFLLHLLLLKVKHHQRKVLILLRNLPR